MKEFRLKPLYDLQDDLIEHKQPKDFGLSYYYIMCAGDIYRELTLKETPAYSYISEKIKVLKGFSPTIGDLAELLRLRTSEFIKKWYCYFIRLAMLEIITEDFQYGEYENRKPILLQCIKVIEAFVRWSVGEIDEEKVKKEIEKLNRLLDEFWSQKKSLG